MKPALFSLAAAALIASLGLPSPASADDDHGHHSCQLPLARTRNPDPARIQHGEDGGLEVTAEGSDDTVGAHPLSQISPYREDIADLARGGDVVTADVRNVQWAVQNVPAGGVVRLRNGKGGQTFRFGRSGVYLPGVHLVGAGRDAAGSPRTVVAGGMLAVRVDFLAPGDRATIADLWFKATIEGAIYSGMADYDRLEILRNKSTGTIAEDFLLHPPEGTFFAGKLHFFATAIGGAAVAPFTGAHAPRCSIKEIVVRGNVSDQLAADASPAGGAEIELASCTYRRLEIAGNDLGSLGLSVELNDNVGNAGELIVEGNRFNAPGNTALWVVGNEGARVLIDDNRIQTSGGFGGVGMILSHHTPGATFLVTRNQLVLDQAVSGLFLGFGGPDPISGAVFADNLFSGTASFGVLAFDGAAWSNSSSNNLFVENDFSGLTAGAFGVFLGAGTTYNVFAKNAGLTAAGFLSLNPTNALK